MLPRIFATTYTNTFVLQISPLFGATFDQPTETNDGIDTASDGDIYRYLKYWYIYHEKQPNKRLPLPRNTQEFSSGMMIVGWLMPRRTGVKKMQEPVLLTFNLATYSYDRLPSLRGYWVQAKNDAAWYWLQEPCDIRPPIAGSKSQLEVHYDALAALAIMSLLVDKILTIDKGIAVAKQNVINVLRDFPLLSIKNLPVERRIEFETYLLATHKQMVLMHLVGHLEELTKTCHFMKSLNKLKPAPLLDEPCNKWIKAANLLSQQRPWGGRLPHVQSARLVFVASETLSGPLTLCESQSSSAGDIASDSYSSSKPAHKRTELVSMSRKKPRMQLSGLTVVSSASATVASTRVIYSVENMAKAGVSVDAKRLIFVDSRFTHSPAASLRSTGGIF
jgi:hypothetical protein